ncbi:hypothetical protein ACFPM3_18995 [Streptomyces coeruleoprunus]|uniref:Secreted protein n=1 Tax=Streptomyces coeruleoprunus TaxID=285563 RepID=A0ABV9XIL6_9ACTN
MFKKVLATAGVAAAALGVSVPTASAVGEGGVHTQNGNFSVQSYGNTGAEPAEGGAAPGDVEASLRALDSGLPGQR